MLAMPFNVEQIRTAHWPAYPQRHSMTDAMLRHATAAHDRLLPLLFAAVPTFPCGATRTWHDTGVGPVLLAVSTDRVVRAT
jgi:hypothetical protein